MLTGLILLVLIGAIVAFGWTRLRGKMKLSVSGKHWLGPIRHRRRARALALV